MKIQISDDVKKALDKTGLFLTAPRGVVDVKVFIFSYQNCILIVVVMYFLAPGVYNLTGYQGSGSKQEQEQGGFCQ